MNMDKYLEEVNQAPVLALTLVIAAGVGFSAGNLGNSGDSADSGLAWEGEYTIEKNGEVIDVEHNTLTKQGQNYIAGKLFNTSDAVEGDNVPTTSNKFAWIGVGNGTKPDYSYDSLNQEIDLSVNEGNISRGLADNYKFTESDGTKSKYTLTKEYKANMPSSEGPITVNTTGLYFNSSGPSMISGGNFSGANLEDGDKLTVTHEISIEG